MIRGIDPLHGCLTATAIGMQFAGLPPVRSTDLREGGTWRKAQQFQLIAESVVIFAPTLLSILLIPGVEVGIAIWH